MKERLTDWLKNNVPADNLIYKDGLKDQCQCICGIVNKLFFHIATDYDSTKDLDERIKISDDFRPYVIGTHRSKSVLLPVMEFNLPKVGIKMIFRYNFYDWCISIESEQDISCNFMGLVTGAKGYFEGFPEDRVYEDYSESNKRNFSICLRDEYDVYTFLFIIRHFIMKK